MAALDIAIGFVVGFIVGVIGTLGCAVFFWDDELDG